MTPSSGANFSSSSFSSTVAPPISTPLSLNFYIYVCLLVGLVIVGCLRPALYFYMTIRSARILHSDMVESVLRAPLAFFEKNTVGEFEFEFRFSSHLNQLWLIRD